MGSCVSSDGQRQSLLVIADKDGEETEFKNFKHSVSVEEAAREYPECFICSWDCLQVGSIMTELRPSQKLNMGEIYFLLPLRKLPNALTQSEMASLLLKVSSALSALPVFPLSFHDENGLNC